MIINSQIVLNSLINPFTFREYDSCLFVYCVVGQIVKNGYILCVPQTYVFIVAGPEALPGHSIHLYSIKIASNIFQKCTYIYAFYHIVKRD